ncbi:MAG: hypothetical protein M0R40_08520 [Firmicutes bacterium]|nr:hypothetical protein [Bacillota bacterium]
MNPFEEKPIPINDGIDDWASIYPVSYSKQRIDPYTKLRIILSNCVEVGEILFKNIFLCNCTNNDLRREVSLLRRIEQQQQKHINWLKPIDETTLETTIGYEHLEVALTACLAQNEPDGYVKQVFEFSLIEDLDHLYRFSNLLDLDSQIPAQQLVQSYVDITPGRPAIAQHRFPFDSVRHSVDFTKADIATKLNILIAASCQQQTENYYMNVGNSYYNDLGRRLYLEIAMIEGDHAGQYRSLIDPNCTWLEKLLLHEYMECYLYHSFYNDEPDKAIREVWGRLFQQELSHLQKAVGLLMQYENKSFEQVIPNAVFPKLIKFDDTRNYVRTVLKEQVLLTADRERYAPIDTLPDDHDYFFYQDRVNHDIKTVASHNVVTSHMQKYNIDYRAEEKTNPVDAFADRTADNTQIARSPNKT